MMMSYRTYGLVITVPYLALIVLFHGYLQTYDSVHKSSPAPSSSKREHYSWALKRGKRNKELSAQNALTGVVKHHLDSKLDLFQDINSKKSASSRTPVKSMQNRSTLLSNKGLLKDRANQIKGLHLNAINPGGYDSSKNLGSDRLHLDQIQAGRKHRRDSVVKEEEDILNNNRKADAEMRGYRFEDLRLKSGLSDRSSDSNRRGLSKWLGAERVKGYQPHHFTPPPSKSSAESVKRPKKQSVVVTHRKSTRGQLRQPQENGTEAKILKPNDSGGSFMANVIDLEVKDWSFNQIGDGHAEDNNKEDTLIKGKSIKPSLLQARPLNASFINSAAGAATREHLQQSEWHSNFPLQPHCVSESQRRPVTKTRTTLSAWDFSDHLQFQSVEGDYIYSAYLDERQAGQPKVRLIALLKREFTKQFFCHFIHPVNNDNNNKLSDNKDSKRNRGSLQPLYETSKVEYYEMCENHAKEYGGYILTCDIPTDWLMKMGGSHTRPCEVTLSVKSKLWEYTMSQQQSESHSKNLTVTLPIFTTNTKPSTDSPSQSPPPSKASRVFHHSKLSLRIHQSNGQRQINVKSNSYNNIPQPPVFKSRQGFGLCVPPIFSYIPSTTLIEFVELTRILGADHITFYQDQVSTEIGRVLDFYRRQGYVTVIPWQMPLEDKSIWYHGQLIAINDCLYRSMHRFKYVTFNDLDEFVVPVKHSNWSEMVKAFDSQSNPTFYSGYSFNSAFFDPLSSSARVLYDLESDLRTKGFSSVRTKVMVMPEKIYELGIHHISRPVNTSLQTFYVGTDLAYVHHYRQCVNDFDPKMNCQLYARDETLLKYIPLLRHTVHRTMWLLKENNTIGAGSKLGQKYGGTRFLVKNIL